MVLFTRYVQLSTQHIQSSMTPMYALALENVLCDLADSLMIFAPPCSDAVERAPHRHIFRRWSAIVSTSTSGTQIQGLSGPGGPSKLTPLKGVVGSQQSAAMLTAVLISPSVGFFCACCLGRDNFCRHCRIV